METANLLNQFIAQHKRGPQSLDELKLFFPEESKSFDDFSNLKDLEQHSWNHLFAEIISELEAQEVYHEYSIRERMLAFFFTLCENLNSVESYAKHYLSAALWPGWTPIALEKASNTFQAYAADMFVLGTDSGEVKQRPMLTEKYPEAAWRMCLIIVEYWRKDKSAEREQTDVMIEKSVNSFFDLTGPLPIDSLIDLGKFIWQRKS